MKKLLPLFIALLCFTNVKAQYVTIPDANFVTYLQSIIPSAMNGNQMNTNSTLVTGMTLLNVSGMSITNLSGIQYFTSLAILQCNGNSLTVLPSLPNSLLRLFCSQNSLSVLPNLPNSLFTLFCDHNSLSTLPTLPNSLHQLACSENNISCFPIFPSLIDSFSIDPNPYNCLPNYITAMYSTDLAKPLCMAGNTNGCEVAGISPYSNVNTNISIYPNPANTIMNVELKMQNEIQGSSLQIIDMLGNTVRQFLIHNSQFSINVADINEGIYTIRISGNEGVVNKRLVIAR